MHDTTQFIRISAAIGQTVHFPCQVCQVVQEHGHIIVRIQVLIAPRASAR